MTLVDGVAMRLVASAAAKALAKATRRTTRPGAIGESLGAASRSAIGRARAVTAPIQLQTHIGASMVLVANLSVLASTTRTTPLTLELEEEEEVEDDDGRGG